MKKLTNYLRKYDQLYKWTHKEIMNYSPTKSMSELSAQTVHILDHGTNKKSGRV